MRNDLPKTHFEAALKHMKERPDSYYERIIETVANTCPKDPTYPDVFRTIVSKIDPINGIDRLPDNMKSSMVYEINVMYHFIHMHLSGERIYYITPQLAARLAQTRISVESYFLKSPYRQIYIQVPTHLFRIQDLDGTMHPISGFYCNFRETPEGKEIRIMASAILPPTPQIPFNDSVFYFRFVLGAGKLDEIIHDYYEKEKNDLVRDGTDYGGKRNIEHVEEFMSFVCNCLLYITSRDPDLTVHTPENLEEKASNLKSNHKLKKLQKRAARVNSYIVIVAGANIKGYEKDVEDMQRVGSVGAWKLTHRVLVSGHWRNQWYGSEKEKSRHQALKWIDSYEKGPDAADVVHKPYLVR